jgi:hypothetical protein
MRMILINVSLVSECLLQRHGGRGDYLVITFVGAYKAYKKGNIDLSQAELVIKHNQLIYKGKVEL